MKVVVAHNRYSSAQPSGENTIVDAELRQLADAGVQVLPFLRSSDDIATLSPAGKAAVAVSPVYARGAQRELASLLDRERPDVLHLHNPYPLLSPWVVRTAHAHGVPVVQTVHNYRQVCASGLYYRDGHICTDCLGRGFPLPAVRHRCYRGSSAQSLAMATALTVHRPTWRTVDQYIALTPAIADHLKTIGITDGQITVKPNSIPDPGEHSEAGDGFVFVGRLTEEKGILLLLDAWRRHPEGTLGTLRIVGDGPARDRVAAAAADRTDVTYAGPADAAGVRAAMRAAACVVVASTWLEPLPTVIIEALANARPVLGTDLGGIPYLIGVDPGTPAGWTGPPDVDALAAALPGAAAAAPGLAGAARRRYLAEFTPDVVLGRLLAVYERVGRTSATGSR